MCSGRDILLIALGTGMVIDASGSGGCNPSLWGAVKTLSVCVLSLLSTVAFIGFSGALSGAGRSLTQAAATSSIAATPSSLDASVGALALDAPSGRPAPGASRDDHRISARLATYVSFHRAWNEGRSAPTASAERARNEQKSRGDWTSRLRRLCNRFVTTMLTRHQPGLIFRAERVPARIVPQGD
jgi:hypothetical protein